jgi:SAM-dependent methyltransferase
MMTLTEPCPICSARASREVQRQHLQLAGLGRVDIGFGNCEACGHIYQVRQAPDHILGRYYSAFSNYTCFDVEAARNAPPSPLTRRLLALAETQGPKKGTAYEVGCATGRHLAHFAKAGWKVGGCDPSPKACEQAREIYGIDVDCGTESDMLPARSGLDMVVFSGVLEHLKDPRGALERAHGALADGGLVLLEVPCATAPHLMPPGWFTFEHLQYFSEASLVRMLYETGFAPLELRIALDVFIYPAIAVIARKTNARINTDDGGLGVAQSRHFLEQVIARDDNLWNNSAKRLRHLDGPVFVWGAGVHTAQLFDRTPLLEQAAVKAIIDRDSQKHGLEQADRPIIAPEAFFAESKDEPVVISSFAAEAEIAAALAKAGVAQDRIVRLYT